MEKAIPELAAEFKISAVWAIERDGDACGVCCGEMSSFHK
jgi:hypothetical protein